MTDQVQQPIGTIDYYVELAESYPFEQQRTIGRTTTVVLEPVGVVAAVVPWNAPLRSIINKLAPALLARPSPSGHRPDHTSPRHQEQPWHSERPQRQRK